MSLVDDSVVTQKSVVSMLAYLLALCFALGYCLVTFWPSSSPLVISTIEPSQGRASETVTIYGSGITNGISVSFDDIAGTIYKTESTSVVLKLPKHDAGQSRVVVKDLNGQTIAIPNAFTFISGSAAPDATKQAIGVTTTVAGAAASGGSEMKQLPAPMNEYHALEGSNLSRISFLSVFDLWLRDNVRVLVVMMIIGALGSLIHVFRSFYWYVGNRTLKNSWLLMYILLPFSGAGLAVLFYLIIRGGISSQAPTNPASFDGYAAMAALVGMFSQEALLKLKQIAGAFFTTAESGKDPAITTLQVKEITPSVGPVAGGTSVTITGTGFATGDQVIFGGIPATSLTVASSSQLIATTPPHAAGTVDVELTSAAGQKSSLPQSFTYQ
jgi:hypothetical protein